MHKPSEGFLNRFLIHVFALRNHRPALHRLPAKQTGCAGAQTGGEDMSHRGRNGSFAQGGLTLVKTARGGMMPAGFPQLDSTAGERHLLA